MTRIVLRSRLADPMIVAVCALGIAQITTWGTSYYCLGVLAGPIAADTGWSRGLVYFGFTVALLAMGLVSAWAGRVIDRHGARGAMSAGIVLVSASLYALAQARSEAGYLAAWAAIGVGMRFCLYDAAFVALVQIVPARGRQAISYLTLFGAFASSVFWVLGHYFNEAYGWRRTLELFALINAGICLPLILAGLARRDARAASSAANAANAAEAAAATPDGPPLQGRARRIAIALFAAILSMNGFVFGVVTVQLVPLLEAAGLTAAAAVWIASLKGFAQFGGRVVEISFGSRLRAITVARLAIGVLPLSFLLLLFAGANVQVILAFTLLMGASQGVITIVRGAVPLALFGANGYGAVLGFIATPILVVNAVSPSLFALIVDRWGWQSAQLALLACASASCLAMEMMSRWYERNCGAAAAAPVDPRQGRGPARR